MGLVLYELQSRRKDCGSRNLPDPSREWSEADAFTIEQADPLAVGDHHLNAVNSCGVDVSTANVVEPWTVRIPQPKDIFGNYVEVLGKHRPSLFLGSS